MLFSLKAAKTVSKHPPLLLTHTSMILQSQIPQCTSSGLAVGSVRVITPTGDVRSCRVGFQRYDPPSLSTRSIGYCTRLSPKDLNTVFTPIRRTRNQ